MMILKIAVLLITLCVFIVSALVVRNDPKNENPFMTVLLCLSLAALVTIDWSVF